MSPNHIYRSENSILFPLIFITLFTCNNIRNPNHLFVHNNCVYSSAHQPVPESFQGLEKSRGTCHTSTPSIVQTGVVRTRQILQKYPSNKRTFVFSPSENSKRNLFYSSRKKKELLKRFILDTNLRENTNEKRNRRK